MMELSVFHIVEVVSFGGDPVATMSNMQTWLDHSGSQPIIFRQMTGDGAEFPFGVQKRRRSCRFRWHLWRPADPARTQSFRCLIQWRFEE